METHAYSIGQMFYMIIDEATALFIFLCRRINNQVVLLSKAQDDVGVDINIK